ncbi:MAG: phosphoglucomutase/phosphomannomutase family protein [Chloroflexota bacterium]|nr:phosphoglucomutase/phosphomannomutase family protein [Chloroflexota bacterium]
MAAPTPTVSYAVLNKRAAGGVIITASHNPAIWNGFKYKMHYAGSAPPEVVAELESRIPPSPEGIPSLPLAQGLERGLVQYFDPSTAFLERLREMVDLERLRRAGLRVVVDSMYGAGAGYFKRLLDGGATEVSELHGQRNPIFPGLERPEPIPPNLDQLSAAVKEKGADVGLATDGDSDRLGVVDENGTFVSPLQVFALLALYLLEVRGERGAIVKTVPGTGMVYPLARLFGVPVLETPVGFKYVAPKLLEEKALLGGEESGGYGFRGHIPERDALLAGLYFLDLMAQSGKTPSQLIAYLYSKVGTYHYRRLDLEFPAAQREAIQRRVAESRPETLGGLRVERQDTTDGFRFTLAGGAWFLIRFSGTEPLLRLYAEAESPERVSRLLDEGKSLVGV